jgi:hypothetical protein
MTEFSKVNVGIPKFVKDYLSLKDNDEPHWDQDAEGNVKYYRLLKRDYTITGRIDLPTDKLAKEKGSDFQVHTA